MVSSTVENYLKALYKLANENAEVNISELSSELEVSKPTVNAMVKTLQQHGWVIYTKYKPLKLTEEGRKAAALILRKHRLTEMFLVEKMGFGWEEVHEIAEQVEHIKAPALFDRMDELMDYPKVDPHGSPIPDKDGNIIQKDSKKLSEHEVGEKVMLIALNHSSKEFLEFLDSRDISLNTVFEIKSVENFDDSMVVSYEKHPSETLSQKVCERLLVEKV
ncbi:metal-dependent transcriptional regulator [Aureivirga marina]|uniref:metal-dependent transcriptional regulator n=1 Tax=Aureivirga marina TaxID=1182451 RepID=UPI0018CB6EFE|nr:metal-dependent transcriptional regulator [Aureivirga marina]